VIMKLNGHIADPWINVLLFRR